MSDKDVTIFDLREGGEYRAYDDGRDTRRTYTVKQGELYNDQGKKGGHYSACQWVPVTANFKFKVITKPYDAETEARVSVIHLKPGRVYTPSGKLEGRVCRIGEELFYVDRSNMPTRRVPLDRIDLNITFQETGAVNERKTLPAPQETPGTLWESREKWEERQSTRRLADAYRGEVEQGMSEAKLKDLIGKKR